MAAIVDVGRAGLKENVPWDCTSGRWRSWVVGGGSLARRARLPSVDCVNDGLSGPGDGPEEHPGAAEAENDDGSGPARGLLDAVDEGNPRGRKQESERQGQPEDFDDRHRNALRSP